MFKNTASQKLTVLAFADAGHATLDAGDKVTGDAANITLKVEQDDDGVRSASNDTNPTETEDGQYVFDLTQAETNGDKLTLYPESSTAGVQVVALPSSVVYTRPVDWANFETSLTNYTAETGLSGTDLAELQSTLSAGIVAETHNDTLIERLQVITAMVEHQRGAHTHQPQGDIFFVDPANGDTHAAGNRGGITDPYSLVQDCHDNAVTSGNHDVIILVAGTDPGPTTLTEDVTLTKNYLFIRGPGRDFLWTRSGSGDTITITGNGVELSGFQLETAGVGLGNGITVTSADFFRASKLWLNDTQGAAIEMTDCDNFVVEQCNLQGSGQSGAGHGIAVIAGAGQTGDYGSIRDCYIHDVAGDGIQLNTTGGGGVNSPMIHNCIIEGCTDDGIDVVGDGVVGAVITNNTLGNNTSIDIEDAGTNTVLANNEQWMKASEDGSSLTAIASVGAVAGAVGSVTGAVGSVTETVDANVIELIGTAITETNAGDVAESFSFFWDVDPVTTQTVDDVGAGGGGDAATATNQTTIITALGTMTDLGGGANVANNLADLAGTTFSTTTDSQEAIRNAITSGSVTVTPVQGIIPDATVGTNITVFYKETKTLSISVIDGDGAAVDVSAMTLTVVIEQTDKTEIAVIEDADITKVTSTASFAIPEAASDTVGNYKWSMRQATGNAVIMYGCWDVRYVADED